MAVWRQATITKISRLLWPLNIDRFETVARLIGVSSVRPSNFPPIPSPKLRVTEYDFSNGNASEEEKESVR